MFQQSVPHYDTGSFKSHRKFLADAEYGDALDAVVKACSDMLLISPDGKRILIGKRNVHPQPDWWFTGGRIFPGETPVQSCCRLLKRELCLDIEPSRFETVCAQSLAWVRSGILIAVAGLGEWSGIVIAITRLGESSGMSGAGSCLQWLAWVYGVG